MVRLHRGRGLASYLGWQRLTTVRRRLHALTVISLAATLALAAGQVAGAQSAAPERSSAAPSPSATTWVAADDGARITKVTPIDERMLEVEIDSPAVGPVSVRLLLPSTFDAQPSLHWPVLFLLQYLGGTYKDWSLWTDVEELTAPLDLLVAMPGAGQGWYTDWWNQGAGGPPMWETFHTVELPQLLERNWRADDRRAVAGVSMGGVGAIAYAARHPGLFAAAASYSGPLETRDLIPMGIHVDPAMWGDPVAQADVWAAHDPVELVPSLEGVELYIAYGDGRTGTKEKPGSGIDSLEQAIAAGNDAFVARLRASGIDAIVDAYGPGTHDWSSWLPAFHRSLPMLLDALGVASPAVD
jgi:diacylglycerol O-acyltransferase/trehalose O-mycolyltransferase